MYKQLYGDKAKQTALRQLSQIYAEFPELAPVTDNQQAILRIVAKLPGASSSQISHVYGRDRKYWAHCVERLEKLGILVSKVTKYPKNTGQMTEHFLVHQLMEPIFERCSRPNRAPGSDD